MWKNYIPFACFSSYHLHVSLIEYRYESTSFYTCVLFNFHIDEFKLRIRLPFGISSRVVVIVDKNTIHKCDFAEYIFDVLSKCDLSSQIIIALLNVHKWYVYVSGIRASAVEFLKATLISFLSHLHYYWFPGVRGISFREISRDCGRNLLISLAMKDVRESQKYFDFGQRLRFIAVSAVINIYRFAPRLPRYGDTSRVRDREATVYPAHISTS